MTPPTRVLICEDEPLARETLRDFIAEHAQLLLVGEASDGAQALKLIRALKPDLVFMDIQMPEITGLEVVRQLEVVPPLIFTTAYDQHAVTAFELNAVDYLLKPFDRSRFLDALNRARATFERQNAGAMKSSSWPCSRISRASVPSIPTAW
ncbi:MAG: response regulator [Aquincola sp.]|nr:response regulator [Aquincola sp.]